MKVEQDDDDKDRDILFSASSRRNHPFPRLPLTITSCTSGEVLFRCFCKRTTPLPDGLLDNATFT
jgi:hypothetical protein